MLLLTLCLILFFFWLLLLGASSCVLLDSVTAVGVCVYLFGVVGLLLGLSIVWLLLRGLQHVAGGSSGVGGEHRD